MVFSVVAQGLLCSARSYKGFYAGVVIMKALFVAIFSVVFSSAAVAVNLQGHMPSGDSVGIALLLAVGVVCLVIARRKPS